MWLGVGVASLVLFLLPFTSSSVVSAFIFIFIYFLFFFCDAEFHHREEDQQVSKLRLHERLTLSSGRFFLSAPPMLHVCVRVCLCAWIAGWVCGQEERERERSVPSCAV